MSLEMALPASYYKIAAGYAKQLAVGNALYTNQCLPGWRSLLVPQRRAMQSH